MEIQLGRRGVLFRIVRVAANAIIRGQYAFPHVPEITAEELSKRLSSGDAPVLIDTRPKEEFNSGFGHLPNARSFPLMELMENFRSGSKYKARMKELEAQFKEIEAFREQEVITICPGGGFSVVAAEIMAEAGFKDVKSLAGGSDGWFKKGFPTTKG